MNYVSTRGSAPVLGFADVVLAGLANDGGLYVPESWPTLGAVTTGSYAELAASVFVPYVGDDIDNATMATLLSVDNAAWSAEIPQIEAHLDSFGAELPSELRDELRELEKRLG